MPTFKDVLFASLFKMCKFFCASVTGEGKKSFPLERENKLSDGIKLLMTVGWVEREHW